MPSISDAHQTIPRILQEYKCPFKIYKTFVREKFTFAVKDIFLGLKKIINFVQFSPLSHSALMMWHWQVQSAAGIWATQSFYQIHHLRKSERTDWKNYIFVKMKISQLQKIWEKQCLYCIHRFWNLRGNFFEKLKIFATFLDIRKSGQHDTFIESNSSPCATQIPTI